MALLRRKIILGAKVEGTKGTAETLTNSEAILVEDISSPYTPEEIVRNTQRDTISRSASIPGSPTATIDFRMELKGGGAATTPPATGAARIATTMMPTGSTVAFTPAASITTATDIPDIMRRTVRSRTAKTAAI